MTATTIFFFFFYLKPLNHLTYLECVLVDVWRKISSKAIYLISLKLYMNNHWIVPYIFFYVD
jgi:hypothetical protein